MIINPSVVKITSGSSTGWWQRPSDWLPIDNLVSAGDDKIVGLYAIFPNDSLEAPGNTLKMLCNFAWTVNWGDGTIADIASGTEASHTYDFDTIDADTETSEGFRQVVVTITATSGNMNNAVQIGRTSDGIVAVNWLDIRISSVYITSFALSLYYTTLLLSKFVWLGDTYSGLALYGFRSAPIKVFLINWVNIASLQYLFYYSAAFDDLGDINSNATSIIYFTTGSFARKVGDVILQGATTTSYAFIGTNVDEIGDIDIRNGASAVGILQNAVNLKKVGAVNITTADSLSYAFYNDYLLASEIVITSSSALVNCAYAFYQMSLVPSISISDASGITNTTGMFGGCPRLAEIRVIGIRVSFSVAGCNMNAAALNTLFGDLADLTGLTAQTITITGNPGAATCDQTIATAKNWTVVS